MVFYLFNSQSNLKLASVSGGSTSDSRAGGPRFETHSSHLYVLSFFLPLIEEGQLSVTRVSMST